MNVKIESKQIGIIGWGKLRQVLYWIFLSFVLSPSSLIPSVKAQVVAVRPDQVAPGMTVVLEVLARASDTGHFGPDGLSPILTRCRIFYPADSNRVVFGPVAVSWLGRLLQVPVFVLPSDTPSTIPFVIQDPKGLDTVLFNVVYPQQFPTLSGNVILGEGAYGPLSDRNTLVVDQLVANDAAITISLRDPDTTRPGNPRLEPITILSKGPISLTNSTISVSAQGLNGGPGGGGGGHGYDTTSGAGGFGFTGGGNCGVRPPTPNSGSDSNSTIEFGGRSITGVLGGGSSPDEDQGGGGGTGAPYGSSGAAGLAKPNSLAGGYGGGSGGGETTPSIGYGGGGGGFGTDGVPGGGGAVQNNGHANGGRFLVPLAGGSGGAAGNSEGLDTLVGSGGGGGGAIALISFDSIIVRSSSVGARGDSGTSGRTKNTPGGAGGSGGAIYLASPIGISISDSEILINGGAGGSGGPGQPNGGAGGLGRLRIDGAKSLPTSMRLAPVASSGASISAEGIAQLGNFMRISGFAPDTINDLDSIRIYFRSEHTNWQHVDTVRARKSGTWSKWIEKGHDSVEFVMVMIKVGSPSRVTANYEPDWILSHVGMVILPQLPSPFLVMLDTLDLGTVRLGHCRTIPVRLENDGGDTLRINSLSLPGGAFSISPAGPIKIAPYSFDTVVVTFCPQQTGSEIAGLTVFSNDSLNPARRIILRGIGTERNDSLTVTPSAVNFSRALLGSCDSATVLLRSVGTDTVYLNAVQWSKPPFTLSLTPADSALAPGATALGTITFCPTDSGDFAASFSLDPRLDILSATGHAAMRKLFIESQADLGALCRGAIATFSASLANIGNDTISLLSVRSSRSSDSALTSNVPGIIPAHGQAIVMWRVQGTMQGGFADTLYYASADSTYATILSYKVLSPSLVIDSLLDFHDLCVGASDTMTLTFRSLSLDTLRVQLGFAKIGRAFTMLDSSVLLTPSGSTNLRVVFHPDSVAIDSVQLIALASTGQCDSAYQVILRGAGTMAALTVSDLFFDTTVVGVCRVDSMLVQNTCGPALRLDSLPVRPPFEFLDTSLLPIVIQSGASREIHFRFCPQHSGVELDTLPLGQPTGGSRPVLHGFGVIPAKPWAHFTVRGVTEQAGSTAPSEVWLDSASMRTTLPVTATLTFDPDVVWPATGGIFAAQGSYAFPTTIDFGTTPQLIKTIDLLGLIGPRSSTILGLRIAPDTIFDLHVTTGLATVLDCTGLSGKVSVSGAYQLGPVTPTIVAKDANVNVVLGNDGFVSGEIVDVTGSSVRVAFAGDFRRGSYRLEVPVDGLASGRYFLRVRSLDWTSVSPFIIEK